MTSQVAVLNLRGIAVASDTVVTRWSEAGTKTIGNTHKIFEIGPSHKVLILHSGKTEINDVPVSVYVGEWSRTITQSLSTLKDYCDSFTHWIAQETLIHSFESENEASIETIREHFRWIRSLTSESVQGAKFLEPEQTLPDDDRANLLSHNIAKSEHFLDSLPPVENLQWEETELFVSNIRGDLEPLFTHYFGRFNVGTTHHEDLLRVAAKALFKFQPISYLDTTLAFVGFGENEAFGGSIKLSTRGIYLGGLRFQIEDRFSVDPNNKTGITHFAQADAIAAFVRGYNAKMRSKFIELFEKTLLSVKPDLKASDELGQLTRSIKDELNEFSNLEFVTPLLNTIEATSLDGLADLADAMVGLQATSTHANEGPATVGGLVELATIDRVQGVTWIRSLASRNRS